MVNRIAVSSTQFKISRPTYDVGTATPAQLAFDGFGERYNGVYLAGSTPTNDGTWTDVVSGNVWFGVQQFVRRSKQINFGKTFATPPQVIYGLRPLGNTTVGSRPRYSYENWNSTYWDALVASAATTTSYLLLAVDWPQFQYGSASADWEFSYVVFQT